MSTMATHRFDALAKALGRRTTRRRTILGLGGGGAAAVALAALPGAPATSAQGTPTAGAGTGGMAENNATLFVQTASGGTFAPNPQAGTPVSSKKLAGPHGSYLVTLQGHSGETIAFSDRPARQFGEVPTPKFFTSMGFTAA